MAHQQQLPLAAWQRRQQAATEAAASSSSPTASQESDCIDLTDDWAAPAPAAAAASSSSSSAAASSSIAASADRNGAMEHSSAEAPAPSHSFSGSAAAAAAFPPTPHAALSAKKRSSSSQLHAPRSGPKLQLTAISHTPAEAPAAASSQVAAASSTAATVAPMSAGVDRKPLQLFGSSIHGETNSLAAVGAHKPVLKLTQQIAQQQQSRPAAAATAAASTQPPPPAPFSRAVAAVAPPLSAAAAKYAKREPPTSASSSAAAAASSASPASASRAPAPAMRRSSTLPSSVAAASASAASSQPPPLLNASGAQYEESEDEVRVRRCSAIDDRLAELDGIVAQIQAEQRSLKSEQRQLKEELDRPMQLPFSAPVRPSAPALGGASALISGSAFWSGRFEWDAAALEAMQRTFGLSSYRVSQREVINATMAKKDCFVIMPTGAGKCWGRNTKLMMFDGRARRVQHIREGDQLMGDDGTPRTVQPGSLIRGNTKNDPAQPAVLMGLKPGRGRGLDAAGRYECKYDKCSFASNSAADRAAHESNAGLHTVVPATSPAMYRVTSSSDGRVSWICNGHHILVLKFNERPSSVKQLPSSAPLPFYYSAFVVDERNIVVEKTLSFATLAEAQAARDLAVQHWAPLEWEGDINTFLRFSKTAQRCAQMFQPDQVRFGARGKRLQQLLTVLWEEDDVQARGGPLLSKRVATHHQTELLAWALGVWLADGSAGLAQSKEDRNSPVHSHAAVVRKLKQVAEQIQGLPSERLVSDGEAERICTVRMGSVFSRVLRHFGIFRKKQFPHQLLSEESEIRMQLLAGSIDGAGDADIERATVEVAAKQRRVIDGLGHLARGLGFSASKVCESKRGNEEFRFTISGADLHQIPVVSPCKRFPSAAERGRSSTKDHRCASFKIEKIGHTNYFGFMLDGNGRCLLADFVVTHNSLLYQLPALLNEGVTLVISPLLSLMEDQLIYLRSVGIEAYMLCGTSSKAEVSHVHKQMLDRHSAMRLLYVSPEKLTKSKQFLSKLEGMYALGKLIRIVIDEAHCCSQWGHDFRPDYKKLNILRLQFKGVPILAVTATATGRVAKDVQSILNIRDCQEFKCSFNRPNLHFSVRPKSGTTKELAADMMHFIQQIGQVGSSGIVYCYSKKETMEMCSALSALGLSCDFYNSDVTPEQRQRVHHRWVKGEVKVVVATNAFGLGINKPDVRFVLHQTIPQGVETMYQEAGRAGRDGHKAWCCLFYSPRDLPRQSTRVYAKQNMTAHLYPLIAYAHQIDQCRRVQMARYFGEVITAEQCNRMCDVCERMGAAEDAAAATGALVDPASFFITRDLSEAAVQICDWVISSGGATAAAASGRGKGKRKQSSASLTQKQLVDECRKKSSSIDALPKGLSRDDVERVIIELMLQGLLVESFRNTAYTTLSYLGVNSDLVSELRQGNLTIQLKFWAKGSEAPAAGAGASPSRRKSVTGKAKAKSATKKESAAAAASSLFAAATPSSFSRAVAGDAEWVDLADDFLEDADGAAAGESSSASAAAAAAAASGDYDAMDPDDQVDEDQYQIELDDAGGELPNEDYDEEEDAMHSHRHDDDEDEGGFGRRGRGGGGGGGGGSDDDSYEEPNDASSEDQPIKKSRREPQSARLAPQQQRRASSTSAAAAAAAGSSAAKPSRSSSSQRPPHRSSAQHSNGDDFAIPPSDDEEAAFQNAMRQSMREF